MYVIIVPLSAVRAQHLHRQRVKGGKFVFTFYGVKTPGESFYLSCKDQRQLRFMYDAVVSRCETYRTGITYHINGKTVSRSVMCEHAHPTVMTHPPHPETNPRWLEQYHKQNNLLDVLLQHSGTSMGELNDICRNVRAFMESSSAARHTNSDS